MRSVVVVLPASMCAMMPMFRNLESSVGFIIPRVSCGPRPAVETAAARPTSLLPAVVRERLVGVGHTVRVLALLDGVAARAGGVHQLVGQPLAHRLLAAGPGVVHEPADRE